MQNNFQKLIRNDFFVTLQPGQVIKSTTKNFGLKQQLHKTLIKYTHNQPIKHGQRDYEELLRALELGFKISVPKQQILDNDYYFKNYSTSGNGKRVQGLSYKPMQEWTDIEFKQWTNYAIKKRPEFDEFVKQKKLSMNQYMQFLTLDQLQQPTSSFAFNYLAPPVSEESDSSDIISNEKKVKGRIIGVYDSQTLLVGVQGFVCKLESINIPPRYHQLRKYLTRSHRSNQIDLKKVYDFYVLDCFWNDSEDRLEIKVGLQQKRMENGKRGDNDVILDKIMDMIKQSK